jgi:hypothetical protein
MRIHTSEDYILTNALYSASLGLEVLPLHGIEADKDGNLVCTCRGKIPGCTAKKSQGKHPLLKGSFKHATTDEATIREWFKWHHPINYGVSTDRGLLVCDIDPRHEGDVTWREIERTHDDMPPTWRQNTGGGGEHHVFKRPPDVSIKSGESRLGRGVDVKASGGYFVGPGCPHISGGQYEWDVGAHPSETPLAMAPDWMLQELAEPQHAQARPPEFYADLARGPVYEGARSQTLCRLFGHLLAKRVDLEVAVELLHAWNEQRCVPPLTAEEFDEIIENISEREARRRGLL